MILSGRTSALGVIAVSRMRTGARSAHHYQTCCALCLWKRLSRFREQLRWMQAPARPLPKSTRRSALLRVCLCVCGKACGQIESGAEGLSCLSGFPGVDSHVCLQVGPPVQKHSPRSDGIAWSCAACIPASSRAAPIRTLLLLHLQQMSFAPSESLLPRLCRALCGLQGCLERVQLCERRDPIAAVDGLP